jgi:hypothetical protein
MWDSAKHPRADRGWFGKVAKAVGRTRSGLSKTDRVDLARSGKTSWYHMASLTTDLYASRRGKHTASVERFRPGLRARADGGYEEVTLRQRYDTGKLGPPRPHSRGGTYRPVVRESGWKQVGIRPRKARKMMGGK